MEWIYDKKLNLRTKICDLSCRLVKRRTQRPSHVSLFLLWHCLPNSSDLLSRFSLPKSHAPSFYHSQLARVWFSQKIDAASKRIVCSYSPDSALRILLCVPLPVYLKNKLFRFENRVFESSASNSNRLCLMPLTPRVWNSWPASWSINNTSCSLTTLFLRTSHSDIQFSFLSLFNSKSNISLSFF